MVHEQSDDKYEPKPLPTETVDLDEGLHEVLERVAEHLHEVWASRRMKEGWRPGQKRDDDLLQHPHLVPYEELPESEKDYDRAAATETVRALLAMGYRVELRN